VTQTNHASSKAGKLTLLVIVTFLSFTSSAQTVDSDVKGSWYAFWGWNRGFYTKSDVRFHGDTYDFTIHDVEAKDRPTPFSLESYFLPVKVSVPQTNWRLGYFYNDHWEISIGQDHMKYVMVQNQTVKMDGQISEPESPFNGVYDQDDMELTKSFLIYEHTDGLNYFNAELTHRMDIFRFSIAKLPFHFEHLHGVGIGALIPRTATDLMDFERYDRFHLAGLGISAKAGVNLHIGRHFFMQFELKSGYINMWDVRTTPSESDGAEQSFFFLQPDFVMGSRFLLGKGDKK
jgi:hypothetical protein